MKRHASTCLVEAVTFTATVAVVLIAEPVHLIRHLWSAWAGPGPQVQMSRMAQMARVATPKERA